MKFKHGNWMILDNMKPTLALEYITHEVCGSDLIVYANTKHIASRGDVVTHGILTVTLSSPMADVIKVNTVHHAGTIAKGPFPEICGCRNEDVQVAEDENFVCYTAGALTAKICKDAFSWGIEYINNKTGEVLTYTGVKNLGHFVNTDDGKCYMTDQLALENGELVYGLGERFGAVVRNGQSMTMWNEDGGTGSDLSYKNIPFYMTSRKYGVYVESTADVSFEVASESVEKVRMSVEGEELSYYIFCGADPKDVMVKYTNLMGKPALPPSWTFGMWMSSCYKVPFDEFSIVENIDKMAAAGIPMSTYHLDFFWSKEYKITNFIWNDETFKNPQAFVQKLRDRGVRINLWFHPYIPQRSEIWAEAAENGYFLKRTNGDIWQTDNWQAGMAIIDFTNPDAYKWFQGKIKGILENYCDSVAADFSEAIPTEDVVFFDGSDPMKMHNYYSYLYNKCVFEAVEAVKGKDKACCFFRSGSAGSQKFPCHWGGDSDANYKSMAAALRAGLSAAVSGFSFWTHDITGFGGKATPDLYKRWSAFGLLLTHTRLHGESFPKEPWNYDEESCQVLGRFSKLKCSLMPYIYAMANNAHEQGVPVLRPMFFEFPDDPAIGYLDTQYMYGDNILVAPIMNEKGTVTYYLPAGTWTNYLTGEVKEGGRYVTETHDYFSLPMMVRQDAIIVSGSEEKADYDFAENPMVRIYELGDGAAATAKIPAKDAGFAGTVTAERNGNVITVTMTGEIKNFTVFVSNRKIAAVEGGTADADGIIKAQAKNVKITLA